MKRPHRISQAQCSQTRRRCPAEKRGGKALQRRSERLAHNCGKVTAEFVLSGLQREILGLVMEGVPPEFFELALLRYWVRLTTWNHALGDERFEAWCAQTSSIREPLLELLREMASSIEDSGPTAEVKGLGELLERNRAVYRREAAGRRLPPHEAERKARLSLTRLGRFLEECHARPVHPSLIETALLYYRLRTATLTADLREDSFQTLERNWPEVTARVDALVERFGSLA